MTAPVIWPMVEYSERPVAWSSFSNSEKKTMPNENVQQMNR